MKAGLFSLGAVALCQLVAAQPHPPLKHLHLHHVREAATEPQPIKVIVYVDASGNQISTETVYPEASVNHASGVDAGANPAAAALPVPTPSSTPAAAPSSKKLDTTSNKSAKGDKGFGLGISYAPYTPDGQCKTAAQIKQDLSVLDFDIVRIYGTDCDQVSAILAAVKGTDKKLFLGIWDITKVKAEAEIIIAAVNANGGDWSKIHTISIGNEVVDKGGSVSALTAAVAEGRAILRAAGFTGPVVAVDTMMAAYAHPEICEASDYCVFNCHAWFDDNVTADKAGAFVEGWVEKMATIAKAKTIAVAESGWPSNGSPHGLAVASPEAQAKAIASLKAALPNNLILYSAFNNPWLVDNAYTHGAEKYWGINGAAPSTY